jgi:hypothetical protein
MNHHPRPHHHLHITKSLINYHPHPLHRIIIFSIYHHPRTIDPKSPLAEHLQLMPWPLHYRVVLPPKYHGSTDPRKLIMCYETAIALARVDEATLVKSLIISLEDAATDWYSRLPPCCIYFWQHLKDKILLNFQLFQVKLDIEEDFMSCAQREKESLPDFYRRFL